MQAIPQSQQQFYQQNPMMYCNPNNPNAPMQQFPYNPNHPHGFPPNACPVYIWPDDEDLDDTDSSEEDLTGKVNMYKASRLAQLYHKYDDPDELPPCCACDCSSCNAPSSRLYIPPSHLPAHHMQRSEVRRTTFPRYDHLRKDHYVLPQHYSNQSVTSVESEDSIRPPAPPNSRSGSPRGKNRV